MSMSRLDTIAYAACPDCAAYIGEPCSFPKRDPRAHAKYVSHTSRVLIATARYNEMSDAVKKALTAPVK